jgi:NADPH2:quinone reductase
MKAVRVHTPGPEENLIFEDAPVPEPGPGQVRVKVAATGVNFIDIYFRMGLYPAPERPFIVGMECAGIVDAVGEGVSEPKPGDRVACAMQRGTYAEYAVLPAWGCVPVPEGMSLETAASVLLQGMTVHYLTHSTFPLAPGHVCLIHAAGGGTGLILTQVAKMRGATVIATASSEEKRAAAKSAGASHVLPYEGFPEAVRALTNGKGVDAVYDSVGKTTFEGSLNSLRPRGMMVTFGNASGPVPPMEPLALTARGSLFLTRPKLGDYCLDRPELLWRAGDVYGWITSGAVTAKIERVYPLAEAAAAHRDLAGRGVSGKLLLKVG